MADNVLESGPPSAKRPKLSSPALSVSASDGNGKCCFYLVCLGIMLYVFIWYYFQLNVIFYSK